MAQRIRGMVPKAPMGRILMKAGAKRVSADAVDAFTDVITEVAEKVKGIIKACSF